MLPRQRVTRFQHRLRRGRTALGSDILRGGVNGCGGIGPVMKVAHLAESFGMHCEIHGNGAPNLAVCGAIRNSRWYERGLLHPFLDYDELPPYLLRQIDPLDADGCVPMPPGPGLGEEIQNALAMDASAVYVLSDHAQYAFRAGADGTPTLWWRAQYDRGSARKVGSIDQGSGTTPTLIGARWIAFADNADGRINAVVMRRDALKPGERRELCKVPLFREGASATDNSMIGWGRSILIENNAGYESAHTQRDWRKVAGGVMRIDIRADESGCDVVWSSPIHAPSSVAKLAAGNGLAYFYTFDLAKDGAGRQVIDWSLVGLDFKTGKVAVRIPTGRGKGFDNNWSSLSLSPQGELYAGTTGGLVQVRHTM